MDLRSTLYSTRGAVTAVARELGISDAAVSQWKRRGIPVRREPEIETALRRHLDRLSTGDAGPETRQ